MNRETLLGLVSIFLGCFFMAINKFSQYHGWINIVGFCLGGGQMIFGMSQVAKYKPKP